jgi:predicted enzyme related to lactoylglutathione lyase
MTQSQEQKATANSGGVEAKLAINGKVAYMEIPALDVEVSAAFYAKVFGWSTRGDARHKGFDDASGDLIGAWTTANAIASAPGVLPYIYVDDVRATLAQITSNGGSVVREPYPEGGLTVATFRDPAGNVIGVWQG